jgi:hypothetical protein
MYLHVGRDLNLSTGQPKSALKYFGSHFFYVSGQSIKLEPNISIVKSDALGVVVVAQVTDVAGWQPWKCTLLVRRRV